MNNKTWESALTIALLFLLLSDQWPKENRVIPAMISAGWGLMALWRFWKDED